MYLSNKILYSCEQNLIANIFAFSFQTQKEEENIGPRSLKKGEKIVINTFIVYIF